MGWQMIERRAFTLSLCNHREARSNKKWNEEKTVDERSKHDDRRSFPVA
jgi:hypothetical protein